MTIEDRITALLADAPQGLRKGQIRRALIDGDDFDNEAFKEAFATMPRDGTILRGRGGVYQLPQHSKLVAGTLSVNPRGFGFVKPDADPDELGDIFIPPKDIGTALSGDRVLVSVEQKNDPRGRAGSVAKVLQERRREVAGTFAMDQGFPYFRPMHRDMPELVPLLAPEDNEASEFPPADGAWMVGRILPRDSSRQPLEAEFVTLINDDDTLSADLDAVVAEFDLPERYCPEDERRASQLKPREIDREDCSRLPVVTIDPEDAKDFDDGISIENGGERGAVVVGVHIADVAAYAAPGSELDIEARKRGFTAYLPGRTLPMLPRPLAADLCSLREGQPRNAHSVFLTIDEASGEVRDFRRVRSRIQVAKRLAFTEVQQLIEQGELPSDCPRAIGKNLNRLVQLARRMRKRRSRKETFLRIHAPDVRVRCAEDPPRILGLERQQQTEANQLVEEYMLAANSAVGCELRNRGIPGVYRIHPEPKARDLESFRDWLNESLSIKVDKLKSREGMNQFLEKHEGTPLGTAIGSAFLRSLQRASYAPEPALHFGLGKECYAHFTSPIRRYSDLLVHQQLWAADQNEELRSKEELAEFAETISERERQTDEAVFAAQDRLKLRYLEERAAEGDDPAMEGVVMRVSAERSTVFLPSVGIFGMLPHNSHQHGRRSGRRNSPPRCGEVVYVEPTETDVVRNELELRRVRLRT